MVRMREFKFSDYGECIAKLLLEMSLEELKSKTTFKGLNPVAERSMLTALQRRYLQLKHEQ